MCLNVVSVLVSCNVIILACFEYSLNVRPAYIMHIVLYAWLRVLFVGLKVLKNCWGCCVHMHQPNSDVGFQ